MKGMSIEKGLIAALALTTAIAAGAAVKMNKEMKMDRGTRTAQETAVKPPAEPVAPAQNTASGCPADAISVIHARTSVRQYAERPIPDEMLLTLVKAGMAAPTAGNRQPWYFIVVTDKEMLNRLGEHPHGGMLKTAGGAIAVIGAPDEGLRGGSGQMWIQDCSAATENILLAAEAVGLGAVWLGVYPVPERISAVREVLGIPEGFEPLSLISIGWPENKPKPKDKYKPEKIFGNTWGSGLVNAEPSPSAH